MEKFTAYIDEAGDEGFGKLANFDYVGGQSKWLVLGAVIIADENRRLTTSWRDDTLKLFPKRKKRDIHWREFKHEQKIAICKSLADKPFGACLTMSHKITIPNSPYEARFKVKGQLYNYLVRWLIERLISAVEQKVGSENAVLKIVFSQRKGTDYESMKNYLTKIASGDDVVKTRTDINWSILDIDGILVENHSKSPGLQIADCATSAFFQGVEANGYGNTEPRYGQLLCQRLIRKRGGSALGAGMTVVPSLEKANCSAEQIEFIKKCSGIK